VIRVGGWGAENFVMARDPDKRAASFEIENTGGFLSGFLAEDDVLDRSGLWRLGSWGVVSVGAVILAVYANQSSITLRRDQVAAADLGRQAQQIQAVATESQNETRRLASAIDTLNGDRDRLYSRISVLEQGLDSVTGAIAKQKAAATVPVAAASPAPVTSTPESSLPASPSPGPGPVVFPVASPVVSPVATTVAKAAEKPPTGAATPEPAPAAVASVAQKNSNAPAAASGPIIANPPVAVATAAISAPPATPAASGMSTRTPAASSTPAPPAAPVAASKSIAEPAVAKSAEPDKPGKTIVVAPLPEVVASVALDDKVDPEGSESKLPVQRTEFGVDVGGANSVAGLRALWRGLLKSRSNTALTTLRPIIVIREGRNGLGMQLRLVAGPLDDAAGAAKICAGLIENERPCETTVFDGQRLAMNAEETAMAAKPAPTKPTGGTHVVHRRSAPKRVATEDPPKPDPPSTLSTFFRR
jgi:hypothetical protein